jgi:short-subunit dehydrogenase
VNIGASTAMECARAGAVVHIVSRTETKLLEIKKWIETEVS